MTQSNFNMDVEVSYSPYEAFLRKHDIQIQEICWSETYYFEASIRGGSQQPEEGDSPKEAVFNLAEANELEGYKDICWTD